MNDNRPLSRTLSRFNQRLTADRTGAFPLTYLILNKPAPESTSVRQANSVSSAPDPEKTSLQCTKNVFDNSSNYRFGFIKNVRKYPPLDRKTAIPVRVF
ncbi:hypothetical protein ACTU44_04610 [Thalassospira sp. SM2505]|uniref:hypothetical protein n=1 Tax=Thalassospira TaxID=168934 RepID=UPI0011BE3BA3|nr:hypothetical protein [Thalassospira profundimaris]